MFEISCTDVEKFFIKSNLRCRPNYLSTLNLDLEKKALSAEHITELLIELKKDLVPF